VGKLPETERHGLDHAIEFGMEQAWRQTDAPFPDPL